MRTPLLIAALVAVPLAISAPAQAQAPNRAGVCTLTGSVPKFHKTMDVRPGGVLSAAKKRPHGALKGRWTKNMKNKYGEYSWVASGPKRTKVLTKNATICALTLDKKGRYGMRKTNLKGLRQAVNKKRLSREWGLVFSKNGQITLIYQIWSA